MAFTDIEIAGHTALLEKHFWSKRRPAGRIRHLMREGQRFDGQSRAVLCATPAFRPDSDHRGVYRQSHVRPRQRKRADLKWHRYDPHPEAASLAEALGVVDQDANGCFFG